MRLFLTGFSRKLALEVKGGAVGVLPTDTVYGIVGTASSPRVVSRIYKLRRRSSGKPFIVLVSSIGDLNRFGARLGGRELGLLKKVWPGRVSVLLPVSGSRFSYLHRKTRQIAFRLPARRSLRNFLAASGPVVAPSANWEGEPPAKNVREAFRYFGDGVDFYVCGGTLRSRPSTLVSLEGSKLKVIRQGAAKIAKSLIL